MKLEAWRTLVVNRRTELAHKEIEEAFGAKITERLVEVRLEVLLDRA